MDIRKLTDDFSVSGQLTALDIEKLAEQGFKTVVNNRPDGEEANQPMHIEIEIAAKKYGMKFIHLPVLPGRATDDNAIRLDRVLKEMPKPIIAYCRTGTRSTTLWALMQSENKTNEEVLALTRAAGYDLSNMTSRLDDMREHLLRRAELDHAHTTTHHNHDHKNGNGLIHKFGHRHEHNYDMPTAPKNSKYSIVIVGGGSAGIAVASSLMKRNSGLEIVIIDPAETHYYQPGWTLVGRGVFLPEFTARPMNEVIPANVGWIKSAVTSFDPDHNKVVLDGGREITYRQLIVCPGLTLDWDAIPGLTAALGRNGVTSNYRYDLAAYTWSLVQNFKGGKVIFTQPPMPIKCAGAPQKAMYLSADYWKRNLLLDKADIQFCNAGAVLFGVAHYVPALMEYINLYGINLNFGRNLIAIDGDAKVATFNENLPDGSKNTVTMNFDMIHVVPPQKSPDFVRNSPLADPAGWLDLDPATLRHKKYDNIFGLGDVSNTANAKTAAAARKQAPVVAHNILKDRGQYDELNSYEGYGSCPLTVELGKIVLAEFSYGGKVTPTFPSWLIEGSKPSRLAWFLKERVLPPLYWKAMLKGREWLAVPSQKEKKLKAADKA